jgi:hypothetical protein
MKREGKGEEERERKERREWKRKGEDQPARGESGKRRGGGRSANVQGKK